MKCEAWKIWRRATSRIRNLSLLAMQWDKPKHTGDQVWELDLNSLLKNKDRLKQYLPSGSD